MATPPLSSPPQFKHELEDRKILSSTFATVVSAAPARKTFGPAGLNTTVCTRKVVGGTDIEPRPSVLQLEALSYP
ncbi:hypothetical protein TNCV_3002941 [Trichonephila clavipes]|nr:hypothetical protein TNCV_3002941 [Trichonephila clavipes]